MLNVWPMTEKVRGKRRKVPVVERATGRPCYGARYADGPTTGEVNPIQAAAYAMESYLREERRREEARAAWTPERAARHTAHLVMCQRVREMA